MIKERDPDGKSAKEPGSKLDVGKPSVYRHFMRYFPRAILAVTEVSEYGAKKYTTDGWVTVPRGIGRYSDGLARHLLDEAKGQVYNKKDGDLLHAAQTAWNALARLELMLREEEDKDVQV